MKNLLFSCFVLPVILVSGCASNHPVVGAWRGNGFTPQRTDKIALTGRPNPNEADAQLGRILVPELQAAGFKIVPTDEADYFLAYAVEDDSTVEHSLRSVTVPTPLGSTPQTTQQVVDGALLRPNQQTVTVPTRFVESRQGIRLYLYTNPKTHRGKFDVAWSGCIDAGERVSADREPLLIRALLGYYGKTYNGEVNLRSPPK